MTAASRYVLFAILSVVVNFATQEVVIAIAPVAPLHLSILAGTGTGFAAKYIMDKKWVFLDGYTTPESELQKVSLYALFSVATTVIFWTFELTFWAVWQTDLAKYAGGALGLCVGYTAKYALDRRFVFRTERT